MVPLMNRTDFDRIQSALFAIPASDRETWYKMASAIKSELGEEGFELWNCWSAQDATYKPRDAQATWKTAKQVGGPTLGSLFHIAKEYGWQGDATIQRDPKQAARMAEQQRQAQRERQQKAVLAAKTSEALLRDAEYDYHPYLASKGFPEQKGLVNGEELLIPVRHFQTEKLQTVQRITPDGGKKFVHGGIAGDGVFRLGDKKARERWFVEGFATALSVRDAVRLLYRQSQIVVCFSASNLANIAVRDAGSPKFIVADHDYFHCPVKTCKTRWDWNQDWGPVFCPQCGMEDNIVAAAGEDAARKTGLPSWTPPDAGMDANDYTQQHGIQALVGELREVVRGEHQVSPD